MNRQSWRLGACAGLGLLGGIGQAWAVAPAMAALVASEQDLIVRFREPQDTPAHAMLAARGSAGIASVRAEIINGPEGVLKLRFDSQAQASAAAERLALSAEVLSVSPDLLYRPAIHYRAHSVQDASPETELAEADAPRPFLALPLSPWISSWIDSPGAPSVDLPPTSVLAGADPLAARDWALASIRLPAVAELASYTGIVKPVTAAVIDTGIDYNHEDLSGALWRNPDNPREVGYDFVHDSSRPYDRVHFDPEGCMNDFACSAGVGQGHYLTNPGHGTHCAGHVGAVANNSLGIRGVGAGAARVMGLKFFYDADDQNAGQGDDAAAIKSIDYAIRHGARVISASWGGRTRRERAESSELKAALERARRAGVLVVVAAGNDGVDQDAVADPSFPAAYDLDNLIVVAAIGRDDRLASFSNYGERSVHIAAPGVKILSTTSGGSYSDVVTRFHGSSGRMEQMDWDGTSMAAPIVAGAAALVWSRIPGADYREVRRRILRSARQVSALEGKVSSGGVLDVAAALALR